MIDKLEVRISERAAFTSEFDSVFNTPDLKARPSLHYKFVADLRPFSYGLILHYSCRHGKERNHKLELVDVGLMTPAEIKREIEEVFEIDALDASIMRIDLAVDVEGISVPWFAEHTRVQFKRWLAKLEIIEAAAMGNREIQTLYFGKRPNVLRIYNKIEEYRMQYRRMVRLLGPDLAIPTFESCFGVPEFGRILTRVERQVAGSRIPAEIGTVRDLQNCAAFNPFERVQFISGGQPEPNPNDYTFMEYLAGMQLRHLAETQGMQAAIAYITRHSKRNKKWALKKFADFLPAPSERDLTGERLFELFQRSVALQFSAHRAA